MGGLAANVYGSPLVTTDIDVTPQRSNENLSRLSVALEELDARIWTQEEPEGFPFDHDAESLAGVEILHMVTRFGRFDVTMTPAGTAGYSDLRREAERLHVFGVEILVASLADIVRSKQASGRDKDLRDLPVLRRLLDEGPPAVTS